MWNTQLSFQIRTLGDGHRKMSSRASLCYTSDSSVCVFHKIVSSINTWITIYIITMVICLLSIWHTMFDPQWRTSFVNQRLSPLTNPHENRIISVSNDLINHPVALLTLSLSLCVFACSGWSYAHLQRSRSHRHHRVWHPRPRSDVGTATTERGVVCHPQPSSACQDGCRVQGLWEHVWSHAWHLPRNIRCVFLHSSLSIVYFKC